MKIYTSYFGRIKRFGDLTPISITARAPRFHKMVNCDMLAPAWSIVKASKEGKMNRKEYDEHYNRQLSEVNIDKLFKMLKEWSNGNDIILLCYEKDLFECHRWNVINWLKSEGIKAEEFEAEMVQKEIIAEQSKNKYKQTQLDL